MKKDFIGTCVNILEEGNLSDIMSDTTDMAQIVENSQKISIEFFTKSTNIPGFLWTNMLSRPRDHEFFLNKEYNLFILYDINEDIHYFFI